jgi:hypothetical protein
LPKSLERYIAEFNEKKHDAGSNAETCSTFDEETTDERVHLLIPKLDLRSLDYLGLIESDDVGTCALRRCRMAGIIIPKLDLRNLNLGAPSDVSTCCAESSGMESSTCSPCSAGSPTFPKAERTNSFGERACLLAPRGAPNCDWRNA